MLKAVVVGGKIADFFAYFQVRVQDVADLV
jgi:hypothetical protein